MKKILPVIKILFTISLLLYISFLFNDSIYLIIGLTEFSIITFLNNLIKKKIILINSLLYLLFYAQLIVLIFGHSFISMIMLTNIDSLQDLSNNFLIYGLGILLIIIISSIRINISNLKFTKKSIVLLSLIATFILLNIYYGTSYSPLMNYYKLGQQYSKFYQFKQRIKNNNNKESMKKFHNNFVENYISYDKSLGESPNIIIIFTEGLSNNIIYDKRNIMPNLKKYQNKSITFNNYYDHTAATYRGIVGQLFSSYQLENNDKNSLIGIQHILQSYDYDTAFINTEPDNKDFVKYLEDFTFNKVLTSDNLNGNNNSITDQAAYDLLFDTAIKYNNQNKPFLLSIYTFGTHASFDSPDYEYGDGTNPMLNKFYNLDNAFGKFMDKFNNSPLYDNTIIVFTADHATYTDLDWATTFNGYYDRYDDFIDEIPLYIYHKDVESKQIDVNGRNSLDLAPTVLDYVDISGENYFLGKSLFSNDEGTEFDTTANYLMNYISTKDDKVKYMDINDPIINKMLEYAAIANN